MPTTSRLIRTVLVAAGLLAISASAAQAMPTRQSNDAGKNPGFAATGHPGGPSLSRSGFSYDGGPAVLHSSGFVLGHQVTLVPAQPMAAAADSPTNQALVSVMQPAADSPTDQTVPLVISQPVPAVTTVSASSGFDWTDAGVGAAVAALLLILAGFAATRVRPRQTAAL